jgi:hypothetical protein
MSAIPRAITPNPHTNLLNVYIYIQIANKKRFQQKKILKHLYGFQYRCEYCRSGPTNSNKTSIVTVAAAGRQCGFPGRPRNGSSATAAPVSRPGDTAHYTCRPGYTLFGEEERVCLDSGIWAGRQPLCGECNLYCVSRCPRGRWCSVLQFNVCMPSIWQILTILSIIERYGNDFILADISH